MLKIAPRQTPESTGSYVVLPTQRKDVPLESHEPEPAFLGQPLKERPLEADTGHLIHRNLATDPGITR